MAKKGFTPDQILNKLREAEILLHQGAILAVILKKIGVSVYRQDKWATSGTKVNGHLGLAPAPPKK